MKLIQDLGVEEYSGEKRRVGLFLCPFCDRTVKKRYDKGIKNESCGCKYKSPPITDYERLSVVYHFANNENNSEKNIVKATGISKHRVKKILTEHLNGKHRVQWAEIQSQMNYIDFDELKNAV